MTVKNDIALLIAPVLTLAVSGKRWNMIHADDGSVNHVLILNMKCAVIIRDSDRMLSLCKSELVDFNVQPHDYSTLMQS